MLGFWNQPGGYMTLREYMIANKITCAAMANDLNVHPMYLNSIKCGKRKPSVQLAIQIELISGGEVTVNDLRGLK